MRLDVELYKENGKTMAYICSDDGASGAKYPCATPDDVGKAVSQYLNDYYPDCVK